jgi:hypothetical protein
MDLMAIQKPSYGQSSPYKNTEVFDNKFLDLINFRSIPREADDLLVQVPVTYQNRPDLMAYDLYGDPGLWWVFAARNPDVIYDPIWDHTSDKYIYLPKKGTLHRVLG